MQLETAVIQVTTCCPYNCPQCYMERGNENLSEEAGKKFIDSLAECGGRLLQITGGEPMLYEHLSGLVSYANTRNLSTIIATSGVGYSAENYKELVRHGLDVLSVSLNDIEENKNAMSREMYSESISAIKMACKAGMICYVNVVVSDLNIDNLEVLSRYLMRIGVERVIIIRPVSSFDGAYLPSLSESTLMKLEQLIKKYPNYYIVERCFKEYWDYTTNDVFECQAARETFVFLNADGTFSPCSQLQQYRYQSIEEMWKEKDIWKGGCFR